MGRFFYWFIFIPTWVFAQIGGRNTFDFIRLTPSARLTALGGSNVSLIDKDVNLAVQNPAVANDSMHHRLSLNVVNYLTDINYGYVGYSRTIPKIGNIHGGILYANYGTMIEADEYGNQFGTFSANEMALITGVSRSFDKFQFGTNFKLLYSNLFRYSSIGMALDFGGLYYNPKLELGVGIVLKNIGLQLTKYTPTGDRESLPFEIQAGITKKLPKAPLRLSLTLTNLQQPNLIYTNPYIPPPVDINGNPLPAKSNVADNILSHIIFGTEILISKNFHLRAAYNHQRRNELKSINQSVGLTGFSFGFGLRVYRFGLDYAFSRYHVAGNVHHFSIATSLSDFLKK